MIYNLMIYNLPFTILSPLKGVRGQYSSEPRIFRQCVTEK